jgi:hypothetical protein
LSFCVTSWRAITNLLTLEVLVRQVLCEDEEEIPLQKGLSYLAKFGYIPEESGIRQVVIIH